MEQGDGGGGTHPLLAGSSSTLVNQPQVMGGCSYVCELTCEGSSLTYKWSLKVSFEAVPGNAPCSNHGYAYFLERLIVYYGLHMTIVRDVH